MTPPTLTASIKTLEEALGLRLFDRSTRAVAPTLQAATFLPVAERLLEDLDHALDDLRGQVGLQTGSVVVAGATSFIAYVLSPAVARLAAAHPGLRVRLVEADTAAVRRGVLDGDADFGVTTLHRRDPALDATALLSDRLGVVCGADHPLAAGGAPVPLAALARHASIALSRQNGVRALIEAEERLPAACRNPAYEVSDVPLLAPLLERGVGIALLPALAARPILKGTLVFRPLRVTIWRRLYLVVPRGRSLAPAASALVALMHEELRAMPAEAFVQVVAAPR